MSRDNSPPFSRGETYYQGRAINSSALEGTELPGRIKEFEDVNINGIGAKSPITAHPVWCMILRNNTGGAVLPGQVVAVDPTLPGSALSVPSTLATMHCLIADEYLPAAGVPVNDLFWAVIQGPATAIADSVATTAGLYVISSATAGDVTAGTSATLAHYEASIGKFLQTLGGSAGQKVRIYVHPPY